ncbi:OmpA family protein [Mesorhizobium sp. LHD-90]|uniref:OmpA family protein n=1 Tax=Mesorhizobium sp. LHD-90 TaxID=3071414 RepID=UPI0027DEE746|nr:OmpA family protein [Mesorhizobium sp. LHD-90]MDQ6432725.1 OmpA family protein [Mesorhizobium sp. LHD-90]
MPLNEMDVLTAVGDAVLNKLDFTVDGLHIRGEAYRKIFELIRDEQILVVSGDDEGLATYSPDTDTIKTQKADSPADLFNKSILVHECTHALTDMEFVKMTAKANESAAYLAQAVYLLLKDPKPTVPAGYGVVKTAIQLARQFGLDSNPGSRRRISYDEIVPLVKRLDEHPGYHSAQARISMSNGISAKIPKHLRVEGSPERIGPSTATATIGFRVPNDELFAFDSFRLKPGAEQRLREAAGYIKQRLGPSHKIYITGHTDNVGGAGYNKRLSRQRAQAVADFFVKEKLFNSSLLQPGGDGEEHPVADNKTPEGRAANRRVVIEAM